MQRNKKKTEIIIKELYNFVFSIVFKPVSSVTSAIKNVLYDIRTNNADSSKGKSRILVNFVIKAVAHPITAPIINDNVKIWQKSPTARKNAFVSNPPPLE